MGRLEIETSHTCQEMIKGLYSGLKSIKLSKPITIEFPVLYPSDKQTIDGELPSSTFSYVDNVFGFSYVFVRDYESEWYPYGYEISEVRIYRYVNEKRYLYGRALDKEGQKILLFNEG